MFEEKNTKKSSGKNYAHLNDRNFEHQFCNESIERSAKTSAVCEQKNQFQKLIWKKVGMHYTTGRSTKCYIQ